MSKHGPLKSGATREDGKIFISYDSNGWEWWVSEKEFQEYRLRKNACTKKCESRPESRARKRTQRNHKYSTDESYRAKVKERVNKQNSDNPTRYLLMLAKGRAKKLGVPFNLREEDVAVPEFCPVLKIPLYRSKGYGPSPNSPTLDRFKPELGYVKGNVFVISSKANRIKNNGTLEEIKSVFLWMQKVEESIK